MPAKEFYSYEAKYVQADGATTKIPADIDGSLSSEIKAVAVKTFQTLECEGVSRVDVFVTPDDQVVVNEINTMPGFTSISMYPKLWEASGMSYTDLITRLIELGIERYERDAKLKTSVE
jgi:D-alanine-D-alanine ligase